MSLKQTILTIVLLLSIFSCFAQDNDSLQLKANWKKGDVKELIIIKSNQLQMADGTLNTLPADTIEGSFLITVTDKNDKGYLVEWKVNSDLPDKEAFPYMTDFLSEYYYIIQTDTTGRFIELTNWKELLERADKLRSIIYAEMKKEKLDKSVLDGLINSLLPQSKEGVEKECNILTGFFHGMYGESVSLNDSVSEESITVPHPYITEGVPATKRTMTKQLDKERISITDAVIYDYDKLKELLKEYMLGKEFSESKTESSSECIYNQLTGWVESVTFHTTMATKDFRSEMNLKYLIR